MIHYNKWRNFREHYLRLQDQTAPPRFKVARYSTRAPPRAEHRSTWVTGIRLA